MRQQANRQTGLKLVGLQIPVFWLYQKKLKARFKTLLANKLETNWGAINCQHYEEIIIATFLSDYELPYDNF